MSLISLFFNNKTRLPKTFILLSILVSGMIYSLLLTDNSPNHNPFRSSNPQSAAVLEPRDDVIDQINFGGENALPLQGYLNNSRTLWFLQVTDTQMAWWEWGTEDRRGPDDGRQKRIRTFFNTTQQIISPLFIFNTGDLVDSAYENYFIRTVGQRVGEWEYYNETLSLPEMGLNSSFYFDMPGNHDVYRSSGYSHFLNYSFSGSAFHTDQYVVNVEFEWGNYQFYALSTPEDHGLEFPFGLGGYLSRDELNWFESKLNALSPTSNLSIAMGHHPLREIYSQTTSTGKQLIPLMQSSGIDLYLFGHGHVNKYENFDGLPAFETAKVDEGSGTYRIVAVDQDQLSTVTPPAEKWPVGLITSPMDYRMAQGDLKPDRVGTPSEIRALAWDRVGIASVEWRMDGASIWSGMNPVEGPLYAAPLEASEIATLGDGELHALEIKITSIDGNITYQSISYSNQLVEIREWFDWWYLYVIAAVGVAAILVSIPTTLRKRNPARWQKTDRTLVQKEYPKWMLGKLFALLVLPMTFGFMDAESFTAVFSLFLVSARGILYSDVAMIFFAATAYSLLPQMFCMSRKYRPLMLYFTFFALFLDCFLYIWYMLHFPTVAWMAVGYYAVIYCDFRIWKHAKSLGKSPKSE
jgi:hypothetical protein